MGPIPSVDRKHLLGPYYQHICFVIKGISRTKQSNGMQGLKHEWFLRMILSKRFVFQYRCYITAKVPRIITPDGKVRTVSVPWARSGSGFTLMMEGVILTLVKHMPVRTVAREIGEHDTKLWRLIDYHVEEALKDQDFSDVSAIGVDEYSHKGHNYITVFLSHPDVATDEAGRCRQAGKARVLFVTEGKDKDAVKRFLERFKEKDGKPGQVKVATSDMIHGTRTWCLIWQGDPLFLLSSCGTWCFLWMEGPFPGQWNSGQETSVLNQGFSWSMTWGIPRRSDSKRS
jgi:hypothetical protein